MNDAGLTQCEYHLLPHISEWGITTEMKARAASARIGGPKAVAMTTASSKGGAGGGRTRKRRRFVQTEAPAHVSASSSSSLSKPSPQVTPNGSSGRKDGGVRLTFLAVAGPHSSESFTTVLTWNGARSLGIGRGDGGGRTPGTSNAWLSLPHDGKVSDRHCMVSLVANVLPQGMPSPRAGCMWPTAAALL